MDMLAPGDFRSRSRSARFNSHDEQNRSSVRICCSELVINAWLAPK